MLKQLERKFGEMAPDWLCALVAIPYWFLHPHKKGVLLVPRGGSWLVLRDGRKFLVPQPYGVQGVAGGSKSRLESSLKKIFSVKKGDVVLEVGASVGVFTLSVADKASKIIAIEPAPHALKYLHRNVGNLSNVHIVEKAVWKCKATVKLHPIRFGGSTLISSNDEGVNVQADTLDNIIAEMQIKKVDFLHMNIEGAEIEALLGAKRTLHLTSKVLIVAHKRDGKLTTTWVSRFLKDRGFTVRVTPKHVVYAWKNV
jgi:FkbM family methyltransferase